MNGYAKFDIPFSEPPQVQFGISHLSEQGGISRIKFEILPNSITKDGFNYNFYTWCDSIVHEASVDWIAVGK